MRTEELLRPYNPLPIEVKFKENIASGDRKGIRSFSKKDTRSFRLTVFKGRERWENRKVGRVPEFGVQHGKV